MRIPQTSFFPHSGFEEAPAANIQFRSDWWRSKQVNFCATPLPCNKEPELFASLPSLWDLEDNRIKKMRSPVICAVAVIVLALALLTHADSDTKSKPKAMPLLRPESAGSFVWTLANYFMWTLASVFIVEQLGGLIARWMVTVEVLIFSRWFTHCFLGQTTYRQGETDLPDKKSRDFGCSLASSRNNV